VRSLVSLVLVGGLTASASASPTPIIGGTVETGDPAVVFLAGYPASRNTMFTCTAVIVSPTAALTAAHCVDHPGFTFGVFLGPDASGSLAELEPQLVPVSEVHIHPGYERDAPFFGDIAVIEFAQPVSVPPLPIMRTRPSEAMVGLSVRIVGYGQIVYDQYNSTKYAATTTIAALDPDDTILIGDANIHTCIGDSGGPALLGGVVIGITSYSDTSGCIDPAHFRRPDAFLAFIDEHAGTMPPPPPEPLPDDEVAEGGCSTTHPSGLLVVLLLTWIRRRR
jgi:secreted trypsin-like serine protease